MGDERKVFSEIVRAAEAGNDILFGESHDMVSVTVKAIMDLMDSVPPETIQGIVLELPVSMAELFETGAADKLGFEGFIRRGLEVEIEDMQEAAIAMFSTDEISEAQFLYVQDWIRDYARTPISTLIAYSHFPDFFDLSKNASAKGVQVVPADRDRERVVAMILSQTDAPPRILVVHRGYAHLDNTAECFDQGFKYGFDDLLEISGRRVTTVSIISEIYSDLRDSSLDPLDLSLLPEAPSQGGFGSDTFSA